MSDSLIYFTCIWDIWDLIDKFFWARSFEDAKNKLRSDKIEMKYALSVNGVYRKAIRQTVLNFS